MRGGRSNMTVIRMAFRNLVRFPKRTVLYGLTVFLLVFSITVSLFVYRACGLAESTLEEHYVFVASLVKRTQGRNIPLSEIFKCTPYKKLLAFNVTVSEGEGVFPAGSALTELPSADRDENPTDVWLEGPGCPIYGVENLGLVYPFFSGECHITQGTALTEKGYCGEADETVIPWWMAERYGLKVGDTVNRRYLRQTGEFAYIYIPTEIVGIYATSSPSPNIENYPAYIPLALAETDYGKILPSATDAGDIRVERADFVLKNREDFADFVAFAQAQGLDFTSANLVFNNSTYDVLCAELQNIGHIALLVFAAATLAGVGTLIFLTVYLCRAREKETAILRALGMKKTKIYALRALEFALLIAVFSSVGFLGGRFAAGAVCDFVNGTVLARASASEEIQDLNASESFVITMPLEKDFNMKISLSPSQIADAAVAVHSLPKLSVNELGISRHPFYLFMTDSENLTATPEAMKAFETREKLRMDIVGVTDLSVFELTETKEFPENFVRIYVNETSPYANEESLFLSADDFGDYVSVLLYEAGISPDGGRLGQVKRYYIAGTYQENEYCSGDDILVSMEDYHKIYSDISVTDHINHFQRIGAVWEKE